MSSSPRPSPAQSPVVPEAASWPRRMVALAVDWSACLLVVGLFTPVYGADAGSASGFVVLGVFVLESALLTATIGGSFGQVATRLRVVRVTGDARPVDLLPAVLRQVLVALVIPAAGLQARWPRPARPRRRHHLRHSPDRARRVSRRLGSCAPDSPPWP